MADEKTTAHPVVSSAKFMQEMDDLLKRVDKTVELGEAFFEGLDLARSKPEGIIGRLSTPKMKEVERGIKEVLDECMQERSIGLPFMGKANPRQATSKFETTTNSKRRKFKI